MAFRASWPDEVENKPGKQLLVRCILGDRNDGNSSTCTISRPRSLRYSSFRKTNCYQGIIIIIIFYKESRAVQLISGNSDHVIQTKSIISIKKNKKLLYLNDSLSVPKIPRHLSDFFKRIIQKSYHLYMSFCITWTRFYVNFSRQRHQLNRTNIERDQLLK